MGQAPRLEVQNLTKRFGSSAAVSDVSLSVEAGQITCLLGPSGCGKSTTLRCVAGVDTLESGRILVDGEPVADDTFSTPPEQRPVGLMFQDFALFPHLTVLDNVCFGVRKAKAERTTRAMEMLEKVSLAQLADRYPHELSGGEQQRVALARALAPRPKIMLMDEPFSGLDNRLRDGIRDDTLAILKEEKTAVLLVTHEPEEAMRMADEIALMRAGKIVQIGAPYNVFRAPVDRDAAAFFSDINVIRGKVQGALTDTAFGQFLVPGVADGTDVEIVIRPQHIKIDFDRSGRGPNPTPQDGTPAKAEVVRSRFLGAESLVEFKLDHDGTMLKAAVPSVFLPKPGTILWLMFRRDRCHVFPA